MIDYLNNGGKVILVTGYTDEETPNIDAILSYMNLSIAKGLVVENDSNGYYRSPYYILPTQSSDSYTSGTYGNTCSCRTLRELLFRRKRAATRQSPAILLMMCS